jgi:hypothetical protein
MDTLVQPGDVILIHVEEKPAFYARVEEILFDAKKGWRQMRFVVLTVPLQEMTWTLEPSQIDGDPFTMGGTPLRIERLADPVPTFPPEESAGAERSKPEGKVISFPPKKGS